MNEPCSFFCLFVKVVVSSAGYFINVDSSVLKLDRFWMLTLNIIFHRLDHAVEEDNPFFLPVTETKQELY